MKSLRFFAIAGLALLSARLAAAAPCDGSTACETPGFDASTQAGWSPSASGMSGLKSLNSTGPTGNITGSRYFFGASSADLGATTAKGSLSTTGDGTRVVGSFALNSGSTPGSTVTGGVVQQLLGNRSYFFYVQACPSGQALDSGFCSAWVRIGSLSTLNYPASVFSTPQRPADATAASISARTSVPGGDVGNISGIQLEIDNLISSGANQSGILLSWSGNTSYVLNNSIYTAAGGFKPNVKYQYRGQVIYPYGVSVPTGGAQTAGPFWTTPASPGPLTVNTVTHCSAQVTVQNAAGSPANPAYTSYQVCANGTGGACKSGVIGGSGSPSDAVTLTITNLNPGTSYTSSAQALVGNGDGSSTGWASSGGTSGAGITTLPWSGTFSVSDVGTSSAVFHISGLSDVASIQNWRIVLNGSTAGTPSGTGDPTGAVTLTGLSAGTAYRVQIQLTETSGCALAVPASPMTFTTSSSTGGTPPPPPPPTPVLTTIKVSPASITLSVLDNQTFTASGFDQFGNPFPLSAVSWSSSVGGINGAGVFHSGSLGTNIRVVATSGGVSGSAFAAVVNLDVSAAYAYPVPFKSTEGTVIHFKGLGSDAKIRIYTITGRLVFHTEVTQDTFDWNVKNDAGESIASGVYPYVIESTANTKHGKLMVIQ